MVSYTASHSILQSFPNSGNLLMRWHKPVIEIAELGFTTQRRWRIISSTFPTLPMGGVRTKKARRTLVGCTRTCKGSCTWNQVQPLEGNDACRAALPFQGMLFNQVHSTLAAAMRTSRALANILATSGTATCACAQTAKILHESCGIGLFPRRRHRIAPESEHQLSRGGEAVTILAKQLASMLPSKAT